MTRHFGKVCVKHPEAGGERMTSNSRCVKCLRAYSHAWVTRKYSEDSVWREKHLDRIGRSRRNVGKGAQYVAARRAAIEQRIPPWVDWGKIQEVYAKAQHLGLTVDHIIPLRGKLVSGLHVHNNLRPLSQPENDSKGNKFIEELL